MWIFGRKKPLDEQMKEEIGEEARHSKELCGDLHEEFKERLRRRDEARKTLERVNEEIRDLQGIGVSLLGRLNAATTTGDEDRMAEFRRSYRRNSRQLDRAGRRREKATRNLAQAELNEREAAEELSRAAATVVEDHAEYVGLVKERLKALMDVLDERHEEVALSAVPLAEEYERRSRPRGELEEAGE